MLSFSFKPNTHIGILLSLARIDAVISTTSGFLDYLMNRCFVILLRRRILRRIVVIYAINRLSEKNNVRLYLNSAQHNAGIRRKYGCPVPPAKNTTIPFSEEYLFARSLENSFVKEPHSNGVKMLVIIPTERKISGNVDAVHHCRKHTDLIRFGAVNVLAGTSSQKFPPPITMPT